MGSCLLGHLTRLYDLLLGQFPGADYDFDQFLLGSLDDRFDLFPSVVSIPLEAAHVDHHIEFYVARPLPPQISARLHYLRRLPALALNRRFPQGEVEHVRLFDRATFE